jgi:N-acetylmuramoyl-L-alanine amidase
MGISRLLLSALILLSLPLAIFAEDDAVDLWELLDSTGAKLQWDPYRQTGIIFRDLTYISFKAGHSQALLNFNELLEIEAITLKNGRLQIPKSGYQQIYTLLTGKPAGDSPYIAAIFIDPGHGGIDPGTVKTHDFSGTQIEVREKDIVLDVALELSKKLKALYPNKLISTSRTDDTFVSLEDRIQLANRINIRQNEAILFISIHANSSFNIKAKGFEVWYLPPEYRRTLIEMDEVEDENEDIIPILNTMLEEEITIESILLAQHILEGLEDAAEGTTLNRGLKEETWFVVRKAKMPSVLVEIGFVSNFEEAQNLLDDGYLMKIAGGIYNGIGKFVAHFENSNFITEK